jgi:endoglucanase
VTRRVPARGRRRCPVVLSRLATRIRRRRHTVSALLASCALTLALGLALVPLAPTPSAEAASTGRLHTDGATIKTSAGEPYVIKGISWFGMETSNCAPHGLWQISLDQGLARIKSYGFTTIRLPYSNECLHATSTTSIDATLNPGLVGKTPQQVMDIVIARAKAYGLNVFLDRHRPDSGAQSELWYTAQWSEKQWIDDWVMLAKRYRNDPTVIGADLHNEPHGTSCWGCGDPKRDWPAAATRAGNAVLAANPDWLIIVEGVEKQASAGTTWWGGGLADAKTRPVTLSVKNRLVYSPHDYPASIFPQSWFSAPTYPANLPGVWDRNWGYLATTKTAPVLLGEFGTKLETTSDQQWLATMVGYLKSSGMSFSYWSFNPNSGDTGGIVKDDWVSPQTAKLKALEPIVHGSGQPTSRPTPTPTPPKPPTPRPSSSSPASTPPPSTPPPSTPPSSTASPSSPASGGALSADYQLQSSWGQGYVAQLAVSSSTGRNGWTISWADADATSVANAWGMTCTVAAGRVTCTGADWGKTIPAGGTVDVGVQLNDPGTAPADPPLTLS